MGTQSNTILFPIACFIFHYFYPCTHTHTHTQSVLTEWMLHKDRGFVGSPLYSQHLEKFQVQSRSSMIVDQINGNATPAKAISSWLSPLVWFVFPFHLRTTCSSPLCEGLLYFQVTHKILIAAAFFPSSAIRSSSI